MNDLGHLRMPRAAAMLGAATHILRLGKSVRRLASLQGVKMEPTMTGHGSRPSTIVSPSA